MLTRDELAEIRDILRHERLSTERALQLLAELALPTTELKWTERITQYKRLEQRIQEELEEEL